MILIAMVLFVMLALFFVCAEAWYEKDWPRSTWKMLVIAFLLLLSGLSAFGQNIRWDQIANTTTGVGQMVPMLALPGAYVSFYTGCTVLPCTTPATTFRSPTDVTGCSSSAQIVWQLPLPQGCQATADSQGNFGAYFLPGAYQYVITVSGHAAGPYYFNVGGGGGGGSGPAPVQIVLPTALIAGNTCTTPATATMMGVLAPTGSTPGTTFAVVPETNPAAVNGWGSIGGLVMQVWATANTVNYSVCNQSSGSITPGALTVDVGAAAGGSGGGGGGGGGSVISFAAPSANWPTWLVPSVLNSTTTPTLSVAASPIPNAALANSSITLGSTPISFGATVTALSALTVNGVLLNSAGSSSTFLDGTGNYSTPAASGVPTVNTNAGPLVMSFSAGAGSCGYSGGTTTCTFTGSGSGGGTVTNFIASAGAWPTWLVPSVATSTTTPTLSVAASAIPNAALANDSFTLGSTGITLGDTAGSVAGLVVNGVNLTTGGSATTFLDGTGNYSTPAGFPITIGSTSIAASSTTTTIAGLTLTTGVVNGVTLTSGGSATSFLNGAGGYTTPAGTGTRTICTGSVALGTAVIASGAAATTVTATCTGLASTDDIMMDFNGSPLGIVGYEPSTAGTLSILKWPSTNTINVSVVNNTGNAVSPGAITLNYRVVR